MIIGLQIVSLVFSIFMIYIALLHYKKGEIGKTEIFVWISIWVFTIFVIIFPDKLQSFARTYFARTFDMMVAGAFILVLTMVTSAYLSARKTEKKMEDLVRKIALKEINNKTKK